MSSEELNLANSCMVQICSQLLLFSDSNEGENQSEQWGEGYRRPKDQTSRAWTTGPDWPFAWLNK